MMTNNQNHVRHRSHGINRNEGFPRRGFSEFDQSKLEKVSVRFWIIHTATTILTSILSMDRVRLVNIVKNSERAKTDWGKGKGKGEREKINRGFADGLPCFACKVPIHKLNLN